jgi:hypothetical protein
MKLKKSKNQLKKLIVQGVNTTEFIGEGKKVGRVFCV